MRGRKRAGLTSAAIVLSLGLGSAAFDAHAVRFDNIEVIITSSTSSLSYGKSGAFTFFIRNETNGTINNIRFRATLSAGEFAAANPIGSGAPATCTRVDLQNIDCSITGGVGSFGFSTFDFEFKAPESGAEVVLSWNVRSGQGQSTKFIQSGVTPGAQPEVVPLISDNTKSAQAYIPPGGDHLFTGNEAVPSGSDDFTVGLLIDPAANKVITGSIDETIPCQQVTHKCAQLQVRKKQTQSDGSLLFFPAHFTGDPATTDLDQKLVFVVRLAASIVAAKNINHASLFYFADGSSTPVQILDCPKGNPGYVPPVGQPPCLARKIEYTRRTAPTPELIGVWEFELWASSNGIIDVSF